MGFGSPPRRRRAIATSFIPPFALMMAALTARGQDPADDPPLPPLPAQSTGEGTEAIAAPIPAASEGISPSDVAERAPATPTSTDAAEDNFQQNITSPSSFGFPIPPSTSQLPDTPPPSKGPTSPLDKLKAGYRLGLDRRIAATGDWFGMRSILADDGLLFYADSALYYQGVTTGGLREKFHFYGHNDYVALGIGKKLGLWDGFFFKVRGETRYGENAANFDAGAILAPALGGSIPVPDQQITALTELLLIQRIGKRVLLQAGKVNTLDGDPSTFAAGRGKRQFLNSSFVFNPIFARTVPYATLGAGVVVLSEKLDPLFSFSILDADPSPRTSGFQDLFDEVTLSGSVRLPVKPFGLVGHQGFTGAWSNKVFTGLELDPRVPIADLPILPRRNGSWALGYSFDQYLWQDTENPKRGWGLFGRLGISDGDPNPIRWFWSVGLGGTGPTASRPLDSFGVGYFALGVKDGTVLDNALHLRDGYGIEAFYNIALTPWARLTPDLQVLHGSLPQADTALLFGLRLQMIY